MVILKAGRTASGAQAAASHTGSLAGADAAYDSAFERSGVIRADSIEKLFDISIAFAYQPLPKSDRVAVVTNAGGPGIMMTDALELSGLCMAHFDEVTKEKLKAALPPSGSIHNPVDVLGDAGGVVYGRAIEVLLSCDTVDSLIVILTPQTMTDDMATANAIVEASKRHRKPILDLLHGRGYHCPGRRYPATEPDSVLPDS